MMGVWLNMCLLGGCGEGVDHNGKMKAQTLGVNDHVWVEELNIEDGLNDGFNIPSDVEDINNETVNVTTIVVDDSDRLNTVDATPTIVHDSGGLNIVDVNNASIVDGPVDANNDTPIGPFLNKHTDIKKRKCDKPIDDIMHNIDEEYESEELESSPKDSDMMNTIIDRDSQNLGKKSCEAISIQGRDEVPTPTRIQKGHA
ncbi:hypothetical protein RJT34_16914 [Clitoria ternatea]|uniref:Uncharacterized protein n=1 Tax=Clitoria ternatea TaxID=43366 RepID=A0AAN9J9K6_CLITE